MRIHKPLAYPRHAGHRCGMSVMRSGARVSKSSQAGIRRRNPHRLCDRSARQRVTERNGGSDSLRGCRASGMPRAPEIMILDTAFWWETTRPRIAAGDARGLRRLMVVSRGHTWGHTVEMPIRDLVLNFHGATINAAREHVQHYLWAMGRARHHRRCAYRGQRRGVLACPPGPVGTGHRVANATVAIQALAFDADLMPAMTQGPEGV